MSVQSIYKGGLVTAENRTENKNNCPKKAFENVEHIVTLSLMFTTIPTKEFTLTFSFVFYIIFNPLFCY